MSELRLSLVAMPWAHRSRPSGALAALAAFVRLRLPEIATTVHHEFVEVSEILGEPVYAAISDECYRIGEMLYATLLYPSQVDTGRAAFHAWAHERLPAADDRTFDVVREGLKAHLESLASRLAETSDAIGFSCSFGQLFASILVARGVKERNPGCRIVLGGSSVSSLAGPSLLQEYPWVDQVIQGEGEQPLEALLRAAQRGTAPTRPEILDRSAIAPAPRLSQVPHLDDLPMPDYDDFAARAERYGIDWGMPIEGSRGCWWDRTARSGDPTQTCYFCNLNTGWEGYREKSVERVVSELAILSTKYRVARAFFLDNIIRHRGVELLGASIAALGRDLELFYEARANIRPHELLAMWEAGLRTMQIGVEGLSSSVLKRIGKGTLAIQNLEAMRLMTELEIRHNGNLIVDFPGSTDEEVAETVSTIERFAVGFEPLTAVPFFLGRGSTVEVMRERFGIVNVRNSDALRAGLPHDVWERLELLDLDFDTTGTRVDWTPVRRAVDAWRGRYRGLSEKLLVYRDCVDFLVLEDNRHGEFRSGSVDGLAREIYLACLESQHLGRLATSFPGFTEGNVTGVVTDFVAEGLMVREGDRVLSLAVATSPHIAARRIGARRRAAEAQASSRALPPLSLIVVP